MPPDPIPDHRRCLRRAWSPFPLPEQELRFAGSLGQAPQEQPGPPFSRKPTASPVKGSLPPRGEPGRHPGGSRAGNRLGPGRHPAQSCGMRWLELQPHQQVLVTVAM